MLLQFRRERIREPKSKRHRAISKWLKCPSPTSTTELFIVFDSGSPIAFRGLLEPFDRTNSLATSCFSSIRLPRYIILKKQVPRLCLLCATPTQLQQVYVWRLSIALVHYTPHKDQWEALLVDF